MSPHARTRRRVGAYAVLAVWLLGAAALAAASARLTRHGVLLATRAAR